MLSSLQLLENILLARNYSENTIGTYSQALKIVSKEFDLESPSLDEQKFLDFIVRLKNKKKSYAYLKNIVMGTKLFYLVIHKFRFKQNYLQFIKKPETLPDILSLVEVKQVLESLDNLKHKVIISLIYSCGLRISEAINLKITDIDSKKMLIKICEAKGKKERYVALSEKLLVLLREYFVHYKPQEYLFAGQDSEQYTARSIQQFLKRALQKCKITKKITVHSFRHSYATHLLEQGTDLKFIQAILGHKNIKTTNLYTHISSANLTKIKNPFDSL